MREWLVTFFGAGKSPVAPGTVGSFATAVLLFALHFVLPSPLAFNILLIAGILAAGAAAVALGPWAIGHFGRKDPGPFVLDEVAGVCLTMLLLPIAPGLRELSVVATAFVAFRIFDVWKPPPCHRLETLPAGWGILMDDLMAAVYANILSQLFLRLCLHLG